ncbi:OmpW family outer membrane protein [Ferrovibrio sp.]|uniref:OmpW/AlkL family protein n=1 Tax=Ferrovibrio sp. TaxID=1917215 RepID=UPI0025BA4439|nr:OmpW family outer membrane protein [Ferrovibrio sp.]MBX3456431.1 OmpW family protein [Ferrovibrio sp.]
MPKGKLIAAAAGAFLLLAGIAATEAAAQQQQQGKSAGDIMLRGRLIGVIPDEDSTVTVIGGKVDASNTWTAEADVSYFFTDNIAAELIAATTKHKMAVNGSTAGNVGLGDVWLLPPTLTLQYHFQPKAAFSPYVGLGATYAIFYNEKVGSGLRSVDYDNAWGVALQAGFDYALGNSWYLNADVKKIFLNTDVTVRTNAGATINADVDLNPWVIGLGVGYKF